MELRHSQKALFLVLAVCIAFSVVFAEVLIADDIGHDCAGDGCPFCLAIATAHNVLKNLRLGALAVFLAACSMIFAQTLPSFTQFPLSLNSPVVLKVRFNS
jgi:hypothetical protein